jgi:hypothetical protein
MPDHIFQREISHACAAILCKMQQMHLALYESQVICGQCSFSFRGRFPVCVFPLYMHATVLIVLPWHICSMSLSFYRLTNPSLGL